MATVRMYRGHWVDYYDANQRRRLERPEGHFEKTKGRVIGRSSAAVRSGG